MKIIEETLKEWKSTPFIWGKSDCMLSICDYVRSITGIDHGLQYRGRYHDQIGANEVLARNGGPIGIIDNAGLPVASRPERGNICVIEIAGIQLGGLCLGEYCAFRRVQGMAEINNHLLNIVKIWEVRK